MGALGKVAAVGMAGVAAAGAGLVAGIGAAVGTAMDFESAMSAVAAVAGGSDADLDRLTQTALQLGRDTTLAGVGATDAAKAMRELAAAGLSVDDIVGGGALGALRLASAGGIDVAQASEIAAMALANFGLKGSEAARVADLFAAASNSSAISVTDISEAMKYVGPIANSMGLSIEEVTAVIAELGNQGIKGSQAGTSLRSMFVSLAKPSKEATKVMKNLGLSFFDANGEMKDLAGISGELKTKMFGLTDQQRAAALATLFGNEALTAATVLYGEGAEGVKKWLNEVTTGATAADVGAKRNNNLRGSLEALKSVGETAAIAFGMKLTPELKGLVDSFAGALSAATPFLTMLGERLGNALTAGVGVLGKFGGYVGGIATALIDAFGKLQGGQITLAQFIGGVKTLVSTVVGDIGSMLGRVGEILSPFLTTVGNGIRTALPIIGAELLKLGQSFGSWITSTAVPAVLAASGQLASALGGWLTTTAIPFLQTNLPVWGAALWGWITDTAVPAVVGAVTSLASAMSDWITTTAIPFLQTNLPMWGAALWDWISNTAVPTVVGRVVGLAAAMSDWVTNVAVPYLQAKLPEWGNAIWGYITDTVVPTVTGLVVGIANAMSDWITNIAVPQIQAKMPEWHQAIVNGINQSEAEHAAAEQVAHDLGERFGEELVTSGVPAIAKAMAAWGDAMNSHGITLQNSASLLGIAVAKKYTDAFDKEGTEGTHKSLMDIQGEILKAMNPNQAIMIELAQGMMEGFWHELQAGWGVVSEWFSSLPGRITGAVGDLGNLLYQAGVDLINGFLLGIQSKIGAIQGLLGGITNMIPKWKGPPDRDATLLVEAGRLIMQGLIDGIDDKQLDLQKKLADVTSGIAKAITDMVGALRLLSRVNFATDTPSGDAIGWFTHLTTSIIATLMEAAKGFDEKALEAVGKFTDTVGKVGGAIKNAVEGLLALGKASWATSSPDGNAMSWFVHLITSLIANFAEAAKAFSAGALQDASAFAESAGKVGGSIKNAVEGLAALAGANWADISPSGGAMAWFTHLIASLTQNFAAAARAFEDGALTAASQFADAASKVAGTVGTAVEALAKLVDFKTPDPARVDALMQAIKAIVARFTAIAQTLTSEGIKATGDFADAASKALGAANAGVQLFAAMAGDKDKSGNNQPIGVPSKEAIDKLVIAIKYVVLQFSYMAQELATEGVKQMQDFASAAGQVLSAAKTGTDLFASMEKLAVPSAKAIDYLLGTIGYVITQTRAIATGIGEEGMRQAQAFADDTLLYVATLKAAFQLFNELDKYKDIPAKMLDQLNAQMVDVLDWGQKLWEQSEALKAVALSFADNMREAARAFASGLSMGAGLSATSPLLAAPAGVGGGFGGFDSLRGGGERVVNLNMYGDVYDTSRFEDRIVATIETATRKGRV